LVELVADVRASTPSKAAQTVLPKRDDLRRLLAERANAVGRALDLRLERGRRALDRIEYRSPIADAVRLLGPRRQAVDTLRTALDVAFERRVARARARLIPLERQLTARAPGAMLEQRRGRVSALRAALERLAADVAPRRRVRITALAAQLANAARAAARRVRGARSRSVAGARLRDRHGRGPGADRSGRRTARHTYRGATRSRNPARARRTRDG
jgi:exodeoxyribonuclease VII large subunit